MTAVPLWRRCCPERIAECSRACFADRRLCRTRFNETVPGPVDGTHDIVRQTACERRAALLPDQFWATSCLGQCSAGSSALFDLFDDIIVSGAEKVAKPDPRIYEIVEARCGRLGADLFFTDDNPANIEAAQARGWDAHLFTDAATLEAQLESAGLFPLGAWRAALPSIKTPPVRTVRGHVRRGQNGRLVWRVTRRLGD